MSTQDVIRKDFSLASTNATEVIAGNLPHVIAAIGGGPEFVRALETAAAALAEVHRAAADLIRRSPLNPELN